MHIEKKRHPKPGAADNGYLSHLNMVKFFYEVQKRSLIFGQRTVVPVQLHFPWRADIVNRNVANIGAIVAAGVLCTEGNAHLLFHQISENW